MPDKNDESGLAMVNAIRAWAVGEGGTPPVGRQDGRSVVRHHFPGRSGSSLNSAPAGLGGATLFPFLSFGALIC